MWISPAYAAEYRDWIARGLFAEIHGYEAVQLPKARTDEHPAKMASSLQGFATCYFTRGVVSLMDGAADAWSDIQCGYWAALYSLLFEIKAVTLPAWSAGRTFAPKKMTELVLTQGLACLFQQTGDVVRLRELIEEHFALETALQGALGRSGRTILKSILEPTKCFSRDELLADRKKCCRERDAWPAPPTEIVPYGVLDVEVALRFPDDAAFHFSNEFKPTDDDHVVKAMVAYHTWYE